MAPPPRPPPTHPEQQQGGPHWAAAMAAAAAASAPNPDMVVDPMNFRFGDFPFPGGLAAFCEYIDIGLSRVKPEFNINYVIILFWPKGPLTLTSILLFFSKELHDSTSRFHFN
jgi:hypothetical protein